MPSSDKIVIAKIISMVSSPLYLFLPLVLIILGSTHLDGHDRLMWGLMLAIFLGFLPFATLWLGLKRGSISDIDFTIREERTPYLLAIIFFWSSAALITLMLDGPQLVFVLILTGIGISLMILLINFFWKISNHTLFFSAAVFFAGRIFSRHYLWFLIFLPVIAWARYAQRKHTMCQLIAGALLGATVICFLRFFGY